jgi:hypothetical protein
MGLHLASLIADINGAYVNEPRSSPPSQMVFPISRDVFAFGFRLSRYKMLNCMAKLFLQLHGGRMGEYIYHTLPDLRYLSCIQNLLIIFQSKIKIPIMVFFIKHITLPTISRTPCSYGNGGIIYQRPLTI